MTKAELFDAYRSYVLKKIARSKNPLGVGTMTLVGKAVQKKFDVSEAGAEKWLAGLRDDGAVVFTNGHWWAR